MTSTIDVYGLMSKYQPQEKGNIAVTVKIGDTERNRIALAKLHRQGVLLHGPYDEPDDEKNHPSQMDFPEDGSSVNEEPVPTEPEEAEPEAKAPAPWERDEVPVS